MQHIIEVLRFATFLGSLLFLAGCVSPRLIQKEDLTEKARHWKEPKVAVWYYAGSKDGRDYFDYRDLGIHEIYCVESGEIPLPHTFPLTRDQKRWILMPWGPASILRSGRQSYSLEQIDLKEKDSHAAQPGATDNPGDAQ